MMHNREKTHYQTLGLTNEATDAEIKQAYRRLVKELHPDKTSDKDKNDQFILIDNAYKVLSDPDLREQYDCGGNQPLRPKKYRLLRKPDNLDDINHYDFINRLFEVDEIKENLIPGQILTAWKKKWLNGQLHHLSGVLHAEREQLLRSRKKSEEHKRRIQLLDRNENKIHQASSILTSINNKKQLLYDLSLGPDVVQPTAEMIEMEQLIGGRTKLTQHVKNQPYIPTAAGIFALRQNNCLNAVNFVELIDGKDEFQFDTISMILMHLDENNLLTQNNFELLMANKQHALPFTHGIRSLKVSGLLNQSSFEELIKCGKGAQTLGSALKTLHKYNLLNHANRKTVIELAQKMDIDLHLLRHLSDIQQALLSEEKKDVMQWRVEETGFQHLCTRINEMFAYGICLLDEDISKAKITMLHALDLKLALKTFYEKPKEQQRHEQQQFTADFKMLLHSKDALMTEHRHYARVIVANIGIAVLAALTGIGLLCLGLYYVYSGSLLFSQTKRKMNRDAVQKELEASVRMC